MYSGATLPDNCLACLPDVFEEVQIQRVPLLGLFSSEGARNVEGRDTFFFAPVELSCARL